MRKSTLGRNVCVRVRNFRELTMGRLAGIRWQVISPSAYRPDSREEKTDLVRASPHWSGKEGKQEMRGILSVEGISFEGLQQHPIGIAVIRDRSVGNAVLV
jgi:hypothetical protein